MNLPFATYEKMLENFAECAMTLDRTRIPPECQIDEEDLVTLIEEEEKFSKFIPGDDALYALEKSLGLG